MGQRQARGRSVRCERSSGNGKEGRSSTRHGRGPVVSYCWMLISDERSPCGMGSAGFLEMLRCRKVSRVPDRGEWPYPGDDGAGVRSNSGGDDADGGENVGLTRKLLPVMWNPV
jgi:hypothetical protein